MSINFKVKEKKIEKKKNKVLETLDSKHMDVLKELNSINNKLPFLENNLKQLKEKLESVILEIKNSNTVLIDDEVLEDKNYSLKYELEEKIRELETEINSIQNNQYYNDYFNKTGHLLYYYYDGNKILDNEYKQNNSDIENDNDDINSQLNSDVSDEETENNSQDDESYDELTKNSYKIELISDDKLVKNGKKIKMTDFIEKENGLEKAELYDKYIKLINNQTFIQKDIFLKKNNAELSNVCYKCNLTLNLIISEGLQVCPKCGRQEFILIDSEKPSFREPPPEVSYFAYKRINHFNEWLSQFQAKESTEIHPDIYKLIFIEMKKERITDLNKITPKKIREYLKKLKLNKYYEHVPHILNKLNNKKVPAISKEIEEKLRNMFKEIQAPFMKVCPPNRKNFLSYSYVLHKFVELLGLDYLKECFPLLKSREKLHQQDQIWKEICRELNWMYIKSI